MPKLPMSQWTAPKSNRQYCQIRREWRARQARTQEIYRTMSDSLASLPWFRFGPPEEDEKPVLLQ
jgi:hypothetical protein